MANANSNSATGPSSVDHLEGLERLAAHIPNAIRDRNAEQALRRAGEAAKAAESNIALLEQLAGFSALVREDIGVTERSQIERDLRDFARSGGRDRRSGYCGNSGGRNRGTTQAFGPSPTCREAHRPSVATTRRSDLRHRWQPRERFANDSRDASDRGRIQQSPQRRYHPETAPRRGGSTSGQFRRTRRPSRGSSREPLSRRRGEGGNRVSSGSIRATGDARPAYPRSTGLAHRSGTRWSSFTLLSESDSGVGLLKTPLHRAPSWRSLLPCWFPFPEADSYRMARTYFSSNPRLKSASGKAPETMSLPTWRHPWQPSTHRRPLSR